MTDNPGAVVTKLGFSRLFSKAWYKAIKPENIINGFRRTGVCPLNREAISVHERPCGELSSSDDDEQTPDSNNKASKRVCHPLCLFSLRNKLVIFKQDMTMAMIYVLTR